MNLRILKKLSKQAAPILIALGDRRQQFRARRRDAYTGLLITDRTCWERGRSLHGGRLRPGEIKRPAADGRGWVWMAPPWHVLKGTLMVGVPGCHEAEWDEECCWVSLMVMVIDHFTDWSALSDDIEAAPAPTRPLTTPSQILMAARDMIAERLEARHGGL